MIVMVSNQTNVEFGYLAGRFPGAIGHLYSPDGKVGPWEFMPYALDNGAYSAHLHKRPFDVPSWLALLEWAANSGQRPLWALVPDVVADRDGTLRAWDLHVETVLSKGFRPAFAVQDGMTFADVPDDECMLFLGGSTPWKERAISEWCPEFPDRVHVGRVNKPDRLNRCWHAGAASVDGTGWFHDKQRMELYRFLKQTMEDGHVRNPPHVPRRSVASVNRRSPRGTQMSQTAWPQIRGGTGD